MAGMGGQFQPGHVPWNTRTTPGCDKPGHDTDYTVARSDGRVVRKCHECAKERGREAAVKRHRRMRQAALDHYGNECACCGESTPVFLAIDHVDGNGNSHRKEISGGRKGSGGSMAVYRWLRDNGYPDGFQTLCHNCNLAKHVLGVCPHQTKEGDAK